MLAYLKKDLLLIKKDAKVYLPMLLVMIFILGSRVETILFVLFFYMLMMEITTFAYEEESSFFSYAVTFPKGRKALVGGKYLSTLVLMAASLVLSFVIYFVLKNFMPVPEMKDFIDLAGTSLLLATLYLNLLIPLNFKFGSNIGRILTIALPFLIVFVVNLLEDHTSLNFGAIFVNINPVFYLIIAGMIFLISYFVSLKVIKTKDF